MFLAGSGDADEFESLLEKLAMRHHVELAELRGEISRLEGDLVHAQRSVRHSRMEETAAPSPASASQPVELETFAEVIKSKNTSFGKRSTGGLTFMSADPKPFPSAAVMQRILRHPLFDLIMCTVIFINTVVFAFEAQYRGLHMANTLGYPGAPDTSNLWPGAEEVFEVLELFFGVIYTCEVVFKLFVMGKQFCFDAWNWIDAAIVLTWLSGKVLGRSIPVNSQVLRLLRMARLMRLLRLVRRIQQFDHLFMMTTAIRGSFGILAWTSAVLFLVHMMLALLVQQWLFYFYFEDPAMTLEDKNQIFEYFGTFSRSLLTFFELTLANWAVPTRVMVEKVSEWSMLLCVIHKLTVGFAVIGVINGVLMQETFKVAHTDDLVMLRTKQKAVATHVDKMRHFFQEADTSQDGQIDFEEFEAIMNNKEVKIWLSAMELDVRDVRQLFDLLDHSGDGDGTLTAEELVLGIAKLRGPARSIDINEIIFRQEKLERILSDVKTDVTRLQARRPHAENPELLNALHQTGSVPWSRTGAG
ncbi:unnamed protein product [Effrenium voratum]|uniref:EF-hand domain-containing protein n=1 Tax=Effrenium voratum TaxID=2562239 RepID=A0AA36MGT9_9DINO|nr:unnamed protein product [Effrenium voratum]